MQSRPAHRDDQPVAGAVAEKVDVPVNWGCCAFAGDRGMLHPELTADTSSVPPAPDELTRQHLKIPASEPCLRLTRRTFSRGGAVSFAYLTSAGSRYRLGGHLNIKPKT